MIPLPNYNNYSIIHESKHSIIYRATHLNSHKSVILKLFKDEYPTPIQVARYRHEYEITKMLYDQLGPIAIHPLEFIKHKNSYGIVLEDANAISLDRVIKKEKLSLPDFFRVAIPVANILGQIHSQNILHKDINPSNIIWNPQLNIIKIIDFGLSTTLNFENYEATSPSAIEGTLSYMSPEQTGRMNRVMDYRSDYYSLGMTFYELLTGELPFKNQDAMELVYAHIAKKPKSPHEILPEIPLMVSNIIMKLIAKTPEERYQGMLGLLLDLKECQRQWIEEKNIRLFPLAAQDVPARFQVSDKLYGREEEIILLTQAFDRVSRGGKELMLVSGYSGVGKSALVHEMQRPIAAHQGYFISGKCDQYKRNIPYQSLVEAFQYLIQQILTEGPERISQWRGILQSALGPNGKVVMNVIPEVKLIIGVQPELNEIGPAEAQKRFSFVFHNFIKAFIREDHPLTIFLDDLQWADASTLELISRLLSDPTTHHLFLIGAYRSNEVNESHMLTLMLSDLKKAHVIYNAIHLAPLELRHVDQLLSDTLHTDISKVRYLAELCYEKTKGNPFFLSRLLLALYEEKLFFFDLKKGAWQWDIEKIKNKAIAENVVTFMSEKIQELSKPTQHILQLAACLGNRFDLKILSKINGKTFHETSADLWEAMREGLIIPENGNYKYIENSMEISVPYRFLHDRVLQSVYSLIPEKEKVELHYRIAKLLILDFSEKERDEKVFEIVNQLNLGSRLIKTDEERIQLVQLNLQAGQKAKLSSAYKAAVSYLKIGQNFLPADAWEKYYTLTYQLTQELSTCLYIAGDHEEAEIMVKQTLEHAKTPLEKSRILTVLVDLYTASGNKNEAMKTAIQALKILGLKIPAFPSRLTLLKEYLLTVWNLKGRKISSLINIPIITDPTLKGILKVLRECQNAAVFSGSNLYPLLVLKEININLRYGNSFESGEGYISYGVLLTMMSVMKKGLEFGQLALKIAEQSNDIFYKGRVISVYAIIIHIWNYHWKTLRPFFKRSIELGIQAGDSNTAAIGCTYILILDPELSLQTIVKESPKYLDMMKPLQFQDLWDSAKVQFQYRANLCGLTDGRYSMSDAEFDELVCLKRMLDSRFVIGAAIYYACKCNIHYFYGDYREALMYVEKAHEFEKTLYGTYNYSEFCFYSFLVYATLYPTLNVKEKWMAWRQMKRKYKKIKKWADNCPVNFSHMKLLMDAEWERLSGRHELAGQLYDQSIAAARENEYVQYEAIGNELAGIFYLNLGKEKLAKFYLHDAHYSYERWGAAAKVKELEAKYPDLIPQEKSFHYPLETSTSASTEKTSSQILDFISIMKASQAIAREIQLQNLIEKMMRIVVENAGAEKGYLILEKQGKYFIEAYADADKVEILSSLPITTLPLEIIKAVALKKESIVLDDASHEPLFNFDPYIITNQPKSILCVPLMNLGSVKGMLYLENNLATAVFTRERLDAINMLSTQMAISINNAFFYRELEDVVKERTRELKESQNLLVQKEKMAFLGMLTRGIGHEIKNPLNFIINFSKFSQEILVNLESYMHSENMISADKPELSSWLDNLRENVNVIYEQGKRADVIVSRMIEHSSVGERQLILLDIHQFLKQILDVSYNQNMKKYPHFDIELKTDFDSSLRYIKIADINLERVLVNLLDNAFYSTYHKKRELGTLYDAEITVKTQRVGDHFEIMVRDNGKGIQSQHADKIFTPFFTTKPVGQGVGLGLSLCYNIIVNEFGGSLSFNSKYGEFAEFIISLPYDETHE
ncbi:MAG: hypothetical protein BGO14_03340 [Chlamydiales bacterium 38-26]|nr:AAA family ATPase [Chlamydiales bacterium]OJV09371.1 MAG: hypothetical protein BGO14_03340 [Chlamydiales bacterium 38-26]